MTDLPIACALGAADFQTRKAGLLASVRGRATALHQLPDGVRLTLPASPEAVEEVLELIRLESACCPFLQFELHLGPAGTPITLTLSGPPGTSAFLAGLGCA